MGFRSFFIVLYVLYFTLLFLEALTFSNDWDFAKRDRSGADLVRCFGIVVWGFAIVCLLDCGRAFVGWVGRFAVCLWESSDLGVSDATAVVCGILFSFNTVQSLAIHASNNYISTITLVNHSALVCLGESALIRLLPLPSHGIPFPTVA